jgi:hypothetical protein
MHWRFRQNEMPRMRFCCSFDISYGLFQNSCLAVYETRIGFDSIEKQMYQNNFNILIRYIPKLNRRNILLPSSGSKDEPRKQRVACHLLVTSLDYFSTLKMEAVHFSVTSVKVYQITRLHIPENSTLFCHQRKLRLHFNTTFYVEQM